MIGCKVICRCRPGGLAAFAVATCLAAPAWATFHFVQIERVIAGVDGDPGAQAIQLRMRFSAQNLVDRGRLVAWDAAGQNPVVLIDFLTAVPGASAGSRILAASENFGVYTAPPAEPDFILARLIPESYLPAGSITFETDDGVLIVWRFSWGGDAYTGDTAGAFTNDVDGEFGPPFPLPLPVEGLSAVVFAGEVSGLSTSNANDYDLSEGAAVVTNNAGVHFALRSPQCPLPITEDPVDDDGDGVGAFCDSCPEDPAKSEPGLCGCGHDDADADGDGSPDCEGDDSPDDPPDHDDGSDPDHPDTDDDPPSDDGPDPGDGADDVGTGGENPDQESPVVNPPRACGMGMILAVLFASCVLAGARRFSTP